MDQRGEWIIKTLQEDYGISTADELNKAIAVAEALDISVFTENKQNVSKMPSKVKAKSKQNSEIEIEYEYESEVYI